MHSGKAIVKQIKESTFPLNSIMQSCMLNFLIIPSCKHNYNTWPLIYASESVSCSVVSDSWQPLGLESARLLCPWGSPGKKTGVGCNFLLQGIFLTQGSNPGLLDCRQNLYYVNHPGSPIYARHCPKPFIDINKGDHLWWCV